MEEHLFTVFTEGWVWMVYLFIREAPLYFSDCYIADSMFFFKEKKISKTSIKNPVVPGSSIKWVSEMDAAELL